MTRRVDALIVGGGPAGLAAGIVLGEAGLNVLLCERKRFPVDKVCGEGVMPTGVQHLKALGVAVCDHFPFAGVCYISPEGRRAAAAFREGQGWGVRRTALSQRLLAQARRVSSLTIMEGTNAVLVSREACGVRANVEGEAVCARLAVGADGLHSPTRRWAGLARVGRRHWRWGARQHYAVAPWSQYVEVYWSGRGVEAYVTPVSAGEVGVAFLWYRGRYEHVEGGAALMPSLLSAFPALAARLHSARPVSEGEAVGPLQQRVGGMVDDGLLLVGDAAGYMDALTGEGLSLALAQARMMASTVAPALQQDTGIVSRRALGRYNTASRALARGTMQVTELALLLSRYPVLCSRVVRALGRDGVLFQRLLSANMGLAPVYQLPTLLRLAWGLARSGS